MRNVIVLTMGLMLSSPLYADQLPADPTRPSASVPQVADMRQQEYRLTSLITGKKKNLAVINGKRVQVGDRLEDARVVAISPNGVLLDLRGEQIFISLTERSGFSKVKSQK